MIELFKNIFRRKAKENEHTASYIKKNNIVIQEFGQVKFSSEPILKPELFDSTEPIGRLSIEKNAKTGETDVFIQDVLIENSYQGEVLDRFLNTKELPWLNFSTIAYDYESIEVVQDIVYASKNVKTIKTDTNKYSFRFSYSDAEEGEVVHVIDRK